MELSRTISSSFVKQPERTIATALFGSLLLSCTSVFAQSYEKNGLPCVQEICIGDGLAALQKIKWEPARDMANQNKPIVRSANVPNEDGLRRALPGYQKAPADALIYLSKHVFDTDGLNAIASIPANCKLDSWQINGKFSGNNGAVTTVGIALQPRPDNLSVQEWRVKSISRTVPQAVSREQQEQIAVDLKARYGKFYTGNVAVSYDPHLPAFVYLVQQVAMNVPFSYALLERPNMTLANEALKHPLCGGNNKVKLD